MYMNIKGSCWESKIGLVCDRPNHSHLRKVVRWVAHPCSGWYRLANKAILGLFQAWGQSWATCGLSKAATDLEKRMTLLQEPPDVHTCCRCKQAKAPLSITVTDASQMYKEISPKQSGAVGGQTDCVGNTNPCCKRNCCAEIKSAHYVTGHMVR